MTSEELPAGTTLGSPGHPTGAEQIAQRWRYLHLLFWFRVTLAVLFATFFYGELGPALLGHHAPGLFAVASIGYALAVGASALGLYTHRPPINSQAALMVYLDVLFITVLMHASGGVESGLGTVLLVSIAGTSLILEGLTSLVFAAIAALAVIGEQIYAEINHSFATTAYTQAGLLGAAFFAMAIVAHVLSLRARKSEALASQRQLDLANLEELNAYIIQRMRTGVLVVDDGCHVRLMNEAARDLLGAPMNQTEQSLAATSMELRESLRRWREQMAPFRIQAGDREIQTQFIQVGENGKAGMLIFLEDLSLVTHQAQQMKLAALGRLTASIAHEIRNPLGAISHAGQLLAESPAFREADRRLTEIIATNSDRVNRVIENILQLSRRRGVQTEQISLGDWLDDFFEEFRDSRGLDSATLSLEPCPNEIRVLFDPSHLHQIVSNLCENALQHGGSQGEIARVVLRASNRDTRGTACLEVLDNGPGIDFASSEQLFEPFFTTRSGGTGLGLYIARELAETNNAHLEYEPVNSGGSCFRLRFAPTSAKEPPK